MNFKKSALAVTLLAVSAAAYANKVPPQLQEFVKSGEIKIEKTFKISEHLTGYVVKDARDKYNIFYVTPDNKFLISGQIFDSKNKSETEKHYAEHVPKPDYSKLWTELEKSAYAVQGDKKGSPVYIFTDPNCGFCKLAYKAFSPYAKEGAQIRWVPVAILDPVDSMKKGAAILESSNQELSLAEKGAGILRGKNDFSAKSKAAIEANTNLMKKYSFGGTPTIIYKDKSGKVVANEGFPRLGMIPAITGVAEQELNDPDLQRFR